VLFRKLSSSALTASVNVKIQTFSRLYACSSVKLATTLVLDLVVLAQHLCFPKIGNKKMSPCSAMGPVRARQANQKALLHCSCKSGRRPLNFACS
jgi:hypothetical protein